MYIIYIYRDTVILYINLTCTLQFIIMNKNIKYM